MSHPTSRRFGRAGQYAQGSRRFDARSLIVALCATALISASACSTTRIISPLGEPGKKEVEAGDTVTVVLLDGRELELVFVEETDCYIVGRDATNAIHRIPRPDIRYLEVTKISAGKTVLMVGAVLLIYGLAQYAADSVFDQLTLPLY